MSSNHKPNRRQRRAMDRIGNKIAERIIKTEAIKKVKNDKSGNNDGSPANDGRG